MSREDQKRWDKRYLEHDLKMGKNPRSWLVAIQDHLPRTGKALDIGANGYIMKPMGLNMLAETVRKVLDKTKT